VLGLAAACGATPARSKAPATPAVKAPAVSGIVDQGVFALTGKGKPLGTEEFTITRGPDGYTIDSVTYLAAAGVIRMHDGHLETDAAWRPRAGLFRDVRDGVTVHALSGVPLRTDETVAGTPGRTVTASGAVDLFVSDSTMVHLAPLCGIAGAARRTAFPAMAITIGPEAAAGALVRRDVDVGGQVKAVIYCDAEARLLGVDIPMTGWAAVRKGFEAEVALAHPAPPAVAPLPDDVVELEREVKVRGKGVVEGATLACALVLPAAHAEARDRALPAVAIVTGSGPQDRDGNSVGGGGIHLSTYRAIAIGLAQGGVAAMRCDDRGTARSTGDFGSATLATFVADAAAVVAALRKERAIDPDRVGIAGHSEGGIIAPMIAARDRRLAGVALLAAPGRPLDAVFLDQVARGLGRTGATADERSRALDRHRAAFAAIRADTPLPDTSEAREWKGSEAWLRSHFAHDPSAIAATLDRVPVLIAHGALDQQVTADDADALVDALRRAKNPRVVVRIYPSLNHMFVHSSTGDISEYADSSGVLDPQLVDDLVEFFAKGLAPR
jgi:dienelactone hydrolase